MMHEGDIYEYYEWLKEADFIATDTENSGTVRPADLWAGLHYCTGVSTAIKRDQTIYSRYFPFRHPAENLEREHLEILRGILTVKKLGFHNAPIDMAALETLGIYITIPPHDGTVMAHMVNEEFPSKALDWLGKFIMKQGKKNDKLKKWTDIWGWDDVPVSLMTPYACEDAEILYMLVEIFLKDMEP